MGVTEMLLSVVWRFIADVRTILQRVLPINRRITDFGSDPLDAFVGAFHLGNDDPGWIERHDEIFVYDEGEYQKE